jgi:class 3 adenylate cyclase
MPAPERQSVFVVVAGFALLGFFCLLASMLPARRVISQVRRAHGAAMTQAAMPVAAGVAGSSSPYEVAGNDTVYPLPPEQQALLGAIWSKKEHILLILLCAAVLFLFLKPYIVHPDLQPDNPGETFRKLNKFWPKLWGSAEVEKLALSCARQSLLNTDLMLRLNSRHLDEFLQCLYITGEHALFMEALLFRRDIFAVALRFEPTLVYGMVGWSSISQFPLDIFIAMLEKLNQRGENALFHQTANSLVRQLVQDGRQKTALGLLEHIPSDMMHPATIEMLLDKCKAVSALPPKYLDSMPSSLIPTAVLALLDDGRDVKTAQRLMARRPRHLWVEKDYLAWLVLQLETDAALAGEFYSVFERSVDIQTHPEIYYSAAQHFESKGHSAMALVIYRRFVSEDINYLDTASRYASLHQNLSLETRNYVIMMTDIKGYSTLCSANPPAFVMAYLKRHNDIIAPLIKDGKGRIVKTIGDSFLAVFESSTLAVNCAVRIQKALQAHNAGKAPLDAINVRIALHGGEVSVAADGDIYGDPVNVASRLEGIAEAGEIWLTDSVMLTTGKTDINCIPVGYQTFKGMEKELMVYRINSVAIADAD